ncbi:hypothetical protein J1N35_000647 [Gossypium stocksii]|uniref:Aminotransferase-like plant mobile domain-containing protein n=1 Tax=Gossypium stocksii TaxID=47602 RepID=A0A9D3WIH7_9ROSI|nr:hypothetical protein J1N35_000647 [Gossypium stocksii]
MRREEEREGEGGTGIAMARLINNDPHISNAVNNMVIYCYLLITEDIALQLGLPIYGSTVTGVSAIVEPAALCYSLLGVLPSNDESNFSGLKFTWLKANFEHLLVNATEEELICAAQAYIMHILRGVFMPNANNNKVHIQYLPLLANLSNVHSYSWGSTVLAVLYREFCRTTKPDTVDIGGEGSLDQQERETWNALGGCAPKIYCDRPGAYEPVADIEAKPEPDLELELEPQPEPERSHTHSTDSSYHPNLLGNDYSPGLVNG